MGASILHVGATVMCPHGGTVSATASSSDVRVGGNPVVVVDDSHNVAGCTFVMGNAPHPCTKIQWVMGAGRVKVHGKPVLLTTSTGLAVAADQAPQGPPNVANSQVRARGT